MPSMAMSQLASCSEAAFGLRSGDALHLQYGGVDSRSSVVSLKQPLPIKELYKHELAMVVVNHIGSLSADGTFL